VTFIKIRSRRRKFSNSDSVEQKITISFNMYIEYSLRESVSAQGREGRGFDSDPGRNLK
jgi:hypothetical protein